MYLNYMCLVTPYLLPAAQLWYAARTWDCRRCVRLERRSFLTGRSFQSSALLASWQEGRIKVIGVLCNLEHLSGNDVMM
ncbi:hypothetical protein F5Y16DRAFT_384682 [Xylariaceae sp. FL0255]|nr:hypothetical protein F5Y16DRAFT_384682 [Xylariaceae sp. FL0255]